MPVNLKDMIATANAAVVTTTPQEVIPLVGRPDLLILDVREPEELRRTGKIPGALHAVRGMLEFYADAQSPYHKPELTPDRPVIVTCASGGRSALAAKTLKDMGFADVRNLAGGMNAWKEANGPVEEVPG
jgi:rhodanese-related sulfurtransferase